MKEETRILKYRGVVTSFDGFVDFVGGDMAMSREGQLFLWTGVKWIVPSFGPENLTAQLLYALERINNDVLEVSAYEKKHGVGNFIMNPGIDRNFNSSFLEVLTALKTLNENLPQMMVYFNQLFNDKHK